MLNPQKSFYVSLTSNGKQDIARRFYVNSKPGVFSRRAVPIIETRLSHGLISNDRMIFQEESSCCSRIGTIFQGMIRRFRQRNESSEEQDTNISELHRTFNKKVKPMKVTELSEEELLKYPLSALVIVAGMMQIKKNQFQTVQILQSVQGTISGSGPFLTVVTCRHLFWIKGEQLGIDMETVRVIPLAKFVKDKPEGLTPNLQRKYLLDSRIKVKLQDYYPKPPNKQQKNTPDPIGKVAGLNDYLFIKIHPKYQSQFRFDSLGHNLVSEDTISQNIEHNLHSFGFTKETLLHYQGDALLVGSSALYKDSSIQRHSDSGSSVTTKQNEIYYIKAIHQGSFFKQQQKKIGGRGLALTNIIFKDLYDNYHYNEHTYDYREKNIEGTQIQEVINEVQKSQSYNETDAVVILILAFNTIQSVGCFYLEKSLSQSSQLKETLITLNLSGCQIGDIGCSHLSKLKLSILSVINFSSNLITKEGVQFILEMLKNNQQLRSFIIKNNEIENQGLSQLVEGSNWSFLNLFDVENNNISEIKCLSNCKWKYLSKLGLKNNSISYESATILFKFKGRLNALNIRENLFEEDKLLKLLKTLNIKEEKISEEEEIQSTKQEDDEDYMERTLATKQVEMQ